MSEWEPPNDANAERKKKTENEDLGENHKYENGGWGNGPPTEYNPAHAKSTRIEDSNDEDSEEERPKRRGRPKTIDAKEACQKSLYIIYNKLRKIRNKTLQDEIANLAEDAALELKHLKDIIDEVL
jgi:hypothetical protein